MTGVDGVPDPWRLIPVLGSAIRDLFPSWKRRRALLTLVALSGITTVAELAAARFFGSLITGNDADGAGSSVLLLALFLISFGAIKGAGYLQNIYKLSVFDRSLSETAMQDEAGRAWQWPLAMELVSLLTQAARLVMVAAVITFVSPPFAMLGIVCAAVSLLIIARGGRTQFNIQMGFAVAQASGSRPTPSEKIAARIVGAERAGLLTMGPVIVLVAFLGYGALAGLVPIDQALVLFIATRIMANLYGTMAGSVMRFVRAQVYVLRASIDLTPLHSDGGDGAADDASTLGDSMDDLESIRAILESPAYRGLAASQAHVKMLDDGRFLGDVSRLRLALRSTESRPSTHRRTRGPFVRTRCRAAAPNEAWRYLMAEVETECGRVMAVIVIDVFSRKVITTAVGTGKPADLVGETLDVAASTEGVNRDAVMTYSDSGATFAAFELADVLKDLGVYRSVTLAAQASPCPSLPSSWRDADHLRSWLDALARWYGVAHYVPEIGWFHPVDVHHGRTAQIMADRLTVLEESYLTNPEWFTDGLPEVASPPVEAFIKAPEITTVTADPVRVGAAASPTYDDEDDV